MAEAARSIPPVPGFADLCETASDMWLVRQLLHSLSKWQSIPYPEGFEALREADREQYIHHDKAVIQEIARRLNVNL